MMSGNVRSSKQATSKTPKSHMQVPDKVQLKEEQLFSNLLAKFTTQLEVALTFQADRLSESEDVALKRSLQRHLQLGERLERARGSAVGDDDVQLKKEVKNSYQNLLRHCNDVFGASAVKREVCNEDMGKGEQLLFDIVMAAIRSKTGQGKEQDDSVLKVTHLQTTSEMLLDERVASVIKKISCIDAEIMNFNTEIEKLTPLTEHEEPLTDEELEPPQKSALHDRLQKELAQLKVQLNELFVANTAREREINEKTEDIEGDIETLIKNFDTEMEATQADLEEREAELQTYDEEIGDWERKLAPLEEKYKAIVAKREAADERMREEQLTLKAKTQATLIIQSWWRGYCVRKALKSKDKKGKVKKGKGKKK